MWRAGALVVGLMAMVAGCGDDDEFPDYEAGNLSNEAHDWVVEGMTCEGEEVVRFVGLVDEGDEGEVERVARTFRGDECLDGGVLFWDELPRESGDDVGVRWSSDEDDWVEMEVETIGERSLRLRGGGEEITMRGVYESLSPTPIPSLDDFDLAGQWWLEDYYCREGSMPQLVQAFHPGVDFRLTKVVGDACIGAGVGFVEAQLEGTRLEGEAWIEEPDEWDQIDGPQDNADLFELIGTVRTEGFISLSLVAGDEEQRAVLRKVEALDD